MVSKLIFIFTFVYGLSSSANASFPAGCPTDNLKQACEALASIPTDKVLVFSDGTEMPACFVHTANPPETEKEIDDRNYFNRFIFNRLLTAYTKEEVELLMTTIAEPASLLPAFKSDPVGTKVLEELIKMNESVRPPRRRQARDIKEDYDFAKKEISEVLKRAKYDHPGSKIKLINTFEEIIYEPTLSARPITCRPNINAFYFSDPRQRHQSLTVYPSVTQYPKFTRLRILGHELAHGFDPCQQDFSDGHPFMKLILCLQKDVGDFKKSVFNGKCDSFTQEAFADSFGLYVAEKWQKSQSVKPLITNVNQADKIIMPPGYEMIIFDLDLTCRERAGSYKGSGSHPSSKNRFKNIVLKNPTVAKTLSCKMDSKTPRCDIEEGFKGEKQPFFDSVIESVKEKFNSNR